jgi:hypothetical protein
MHPSLQRQAAARAPVPHILAAFAIHPMLGTAQTGNYGRIKMLPRQNAGMIGSPIADVVTRC